MSDAGALETPLHDSVELDALACLRVRAASAIASHHSVPVRDEVVKINVEIGKQLIHGSHHPLVVPHAGLFAAWAIVIEEVPGHALANHLRLLPVDEVFETGAGENSFIAIG